MTKRKERCFARRASATAPACLAEEHRRFAALNQQRHRLLPRAILLGLLSGFAAVGFHLALDAAEFQRNRMIFWARQLGPDGLWIPVMVLGVSVFTAAWLVRHFAPEASGSGIPHLKAVLQGYRTFRWVRVLLVKFLSGVVGIGGGLALGREGPTVQMGGALGQGIGCLRGAAANEQRVLVAAGGGAGLSAAFNAPLSGLVFVLEELQGRFTSLEFFTAAVACLSSDMVCRAILGSFPVFHLPPVSAPALPLLPAFVPIGLLCGLLGVLFNRSLLMAQKLGSGESRRGQGWWIVWGMLLGVCGWLAPEMLGGGQSFAAGVLDGHALELKFVPYYFAARFVLTVVSYGTGVAGGIFAPILVLGALVGLGVGQTTAILYPSLSVEPYVFAVAGMAAFFTASVRAPLTGVVLMIEMTGNYSLILPLLVGCFTALMIADWFHDTPIYEALLERDLAKLTNGKPTAHFPPTASPFQSPAPQANETLAERLPKSR